MMRRCIMPSVQRDLPSGTVTFLFTDVEGSTKLLHELGPDRYAATLAEHRRIVRDAFEARGGVEVDTQGDGFFVAFPSASGALAAARAITDRLASGPIKVRMGLHTGTPLLTAEGYIGTDVHRAARIGAAGYGGQVVVSAATVELTGTEGLRDLGEHRLKDFNEPMPLFQIGDERFPPLKTISNTNLPRPASSFVGRDTEVAEVVAHLRDGARLLTLTGPGGSGKTRLAIEVAATLVTEFKAGVFWVDLAPLRDSDLVTETIGQVIGAKDGLTGHIGHREMLLLLDNLEQVVAAAPELATLVEACPNLRLLVTSRERLRVRGEVEFPVAPLADADAVELFCARAQVEPDETARQLCRALDNLPLALELAAARASVLTPAQILDRLSGRLDLLKGGRDADPRQQTLRATIAWSHELLSPDDQLLFARLAVFRGGWTVPAAEEVAQASLDGLESLVDKSLVRHVDDRFWMLETIREYASERLDESAEVGALRRRHADFFLALAEETEPRLRDEELGGGGREWLDRQERELDNSRAALDLFEESGDRPRLQRMAGSLAVVWANNGHPVEGRRRMERALSLDLSPTAARAKALDAAAEMATFSDDTTAVREWAQEALEIYRRLGNQWGVADALSSLGIGYGEGGDWERARRLFDESLQMFREVGDEARAMWGTRSLAWATAEIGDLPGARVLYEDALQQGRAAGNRLLESVVLGSLSWLAIREGRVEDTPALLKESLRIKRDMGNLLETAVGLCHAAQTLAAVGRPDTSAQLIASYEALSEEIGSWPWVNRMRDETLAVIRAQLDPQEFELAWTHGRSMSAEEAVAVALDALEALDEQAIGEVTAGPAPPERARPPGGAGSPRRR
jgi:predicted ATPase/class 3 adenylate cyclase